MGEVPIYNPLGSHSPAYGHYCAWYLDWRRDEPRSRPGLRTGASGAGPAPDTQRLLKRYRPHLAARLKSAPETSTFALPDELSQDESEFPQKARSYVTRVCADADLPEQVRTPRIVFPAVDVFDARCINVNGTAAVFVTTRALAVIQSFARTVSVCARLNMLAAPGVLAEGRKQPPCVLLAWETITGFPGVGMALRQFLQLTPARDLRATVNRQLFDGPESVAAAGGRHQGRALLSSLLIQAMLQTVSNCLRGRPGVEPVLAATSAPYIVASDHSIDHEYLALLMLSFVVLHETGHVVLDHNSLQPRDTPVDTMLREVARRAEAWAAKESSVTSFRNLMDTVASHEMAADRFALTVASDSIRDPMLEAATLWCTALEAADESHQDWIEKIQHGKQGDHPPMMTRVHQLNGRFSLGARAGYPAQETTRRAQSMADRVGPDMLPADGLARIFPVLWEIALREIRD